MKKFFNKKILNFISILIILSILIFHYQIFKNQKETNFHIEFYIQGIGYDQFNRDIIPMVQNAFKEDIFFKKPKIENAKNSFPSKIILFFTSENLLNDLVLENLDTQFKKYTDQYASLYEFFDLKKEAPQVQFNRILRENKISHDISLIIIILLLNLIFIFQIKKVSS